MKILFLDFDGVLNSWRYFKDAHTAGRTLQTPQDQIDPKAVRWLNEIFLKTGCHVVVSSTWRRLHRMPDLRGWLKQAGFTGAVIDRTPSINDVDRGVEIDAWLKAHVRLPVESFAILDDGSDMAPHMDKLVLVDARKGLKPKHADAAVALLGAAAIGAPIVMAGDDPNPVPIAAVRIGACT
jgi:hypothetical protein